jgi:hypothetical protein
LRTDRVAEKIRVRAEYERDARACSEATIAGTTPDQA